MDDEGLKSGFGGVRVGVVEAVEKLYRLSLYIYVDTFDGEFGRNQLPEYGTIAGGSNIDIEGADKDIWNLLRDGEADIPMKSFGEPT